MFNPEIVLEKQRVELTKIDRQNRLLTEVDHLISGSINNSIFDPDVEADVLQNLQTAIQEMAMPYAITTTEHVVVEDAEKQTRNIRWMGKTAVENAMSGYKFHKHEAALKRVAVEVDEARLADTQKADNSVRVFISPRMTEYDADIDIARSEHLGDDDAIRISWMEERDGETKRIMQSLLVRDIPFSAWVDMLKDPNNVFGKSIELENETSALSVMKVHSELEISSDMIPEGLLTILKGVTKYIQDKDTLQKVEVQIKQYHEMNQAELAEHARLKAEEWIVYEKELAESLLQKKATYQIRRDINTMQHLWSDEDLQIILAHQLPNAHYRMSRELASVLESAKQKRLSGRAALIGNKKHVMLQISEGQYQTLLRDEILLITAQQFGGFMYQQAAIHERAISRKNIDAGGGGCAGKNNTKFNDVPNNELSQLSIEGTESSSDDSENWSWKDGVCVIESCKTRPGKTKVGPCSICQHCQKRFDVGEDPTKDRIRYDQKKRNKSVAELLTFAGALS